MSNDNGCFVYKIGKGCQPSPKILGFLRKVEPLQSESAPKDQVIAEADGKYVNSYTSFSDRSETEYNLIWIRSA
jgi:hypothetical protein